VGVGGSTLRSPSCAAASPSCSPTGTLALHRSRDGSFRLQPREVKIEPKEKVKDESGDEHAEACKSDVQPLIRIGDLDPFAQSAIAALSSRAATKASAKKAAPTSTTPGPTMKRPAAAAGAFIPQKNEKKVKKEVKSKTEAKPALKIERSNVNAVKKEPIEIVTTSRIMSAMPKAITGSNPPAVNYKKGVIYTSIKAKRFRALLVRGDKWQERSSAWGTKAKDKKEAWATCVKAIDNHRAKK
jgi:hypothetical protein